MTHSTRILPSLIFSQQHETHAREQNTLVVSNTAARPKNRKASTQYGRAQQIVAAASTIDGKHGGIY